MPASAAARRYAQAAFDIGQEQGTLDQWADDLRYISETLMADPDVLRVLRSPDAPLAEKRKFLDRLFAQKVGPLARNLVDLLLKRERIALLPQVEEAFDELHLAAQGIAYADVTTAVPLDAAEEKRVSEQLSRLTGKTIRIRAAVDPDVLGGIVAQVGDQLIDGTVATQLRLLRNRLTAV